MGDSGSPVLQRVLLKQCYEHKCLNNLEKPWTKCHEAQDAQNEDISRWGWWGEEALVSMGSAWEVCIGSECGCVRAPLSLNHGGKVDIGEESSILGSVSPNSDWAVVAVARKRRWWLKKEGGTCQNVYITLRRVRSNSTPKARSYNRNFQSLYQLYVGLTSPVNVGSQQKLQNKTIILWLLCVTLHILFVCLVW